nr:ATP-binding protein [Paenibacillus rigui]
MGSLVGCGIRQLPASEPSIQAEQGKLDLTGWHFKNDGNKALDGEWDFFWGQLLEPGQVKAALKEGPAPERIQLPHTWNGYEQEGTKLPGSGFATFHLQVTLPASSGVMALELPTIRTAYTLWINGQPMGGSGVVGTDRATSEPSYMPRLVYFNAVDPALDIVIQVSNFDHRTGGIWNKIWLGDADKLTSNHNRSLIIDAMLIGSLLLMGLYHLGLFVMRFKERGSLYFAIFCILAGVRAMFVGEGTMFLLFPDLPWLTGLRLEYISYYLSVPLIVMFCRGLYPQVFRLGYIRAIQGTGLAASILVILLPSNIFTYVTPAYQIFTIAVCVYCIVCFTEGVRNKRDGALFVLTGVIVYTVTILIDLLYINEYIDKGNVSAIGLFYCIFMTSFIISLKSFRAFAAVETLSRQLRELNMGLEHRIKERTAELEKSNRTLEKMNEDLGRLEKSRRHLLSNISHDLGTPMTLIQGYVEALIDKVVVDPEQQEKYLRLILTRINGLNRLITDLFQLSKLEARQIDFNMQEMTIDDFVQYYRDRYELEVRNAGLSFSLQAYLHAVPELRQSGHVIYIDIDRIDQVLTNIIYNAIKHTPAGGAIVLQILTDSSSLVMKVQDNGSGIDPDDLPYIFDRFYKKDKSRNSAEGGSGLGLAIAKEIVEFHGGRIWAESRLHQGACISFALPLRESQRRLRA